MNIEFTRHCDLTEVALVVGVWEGETSPAGAPVGGESNLVELFLQHQYERGLFTGKLGETVVLPMTVDAGLKTIVLVGLGRASELTPLQCEAIGGAATERLSKLFERKALFNIDFAASGTMPIEVSSGHLALGIKLRNYSYDKWKTDSGRQRATTLSEVIVISEEANRSAAYYQHRSGLVDGIHLARDLVNEPPNSLNPDTFAAALAGLEDDGVVIRSVCEDELKSMGLSAILAVGQSSMFSPRLVILEWNGGRPGDAPVALVGKGITFDTGGLAIKPIEHMKTMKGDMAGAASVAGAIHALARARVKVNAVGVLALAENCISGTAYRPSDVIRTARGDTIEICHTDAEGRLALLDAMWFVTRQYSPASLVSIGTLGGSGLFGLGLKYGALYTENDVMRDGMLKSASESGDLLWQLPVYDEMDEQLQSSDIADVIQVPDFFTWGADSGYVYKLLKPSVETRYWAHVEMCRLEFAMKDRSTCPKGATGWGVRLLAEYSAEFAPAKKLSPAA
ncbi:MAG: M17 family peptidase N-terminal domain-containing protein [Haliea sp.]